jgi:hypothetical protein
VPCTGNGIEYERVGDRRMSIVISVKTSDGLILAANSLTAYLDSATQPPRKIFNNAHRIFDLSDCAPLGAVAFGIGGIGPDSIASLSVGLRERMRRELTVAESGAARTVQDVARHARSIFFEESYLRAYPNPLPGFKMGYRVCGFSADTLSPEIWEFTIEGAVCNGPYEVQPHGKLGISWAGEIDVLDRLLLGQEGGVRAALLERGYTEEEVQGIYLEIIARLGDGSEARLTSTSAAVGTAKFLIELAPSLLAPSPKTHARAFVEIAAITRQRGFHWILRRQHADGDMGNPRAQPSLASS